jgi:hypothetical protein
MISMKTKSNGKVEEKWMNKMLNDKDRLWKDEIKGCTRYEDEWILTPTVMSLLVILCTGALLAPFAGW